ncbi:hypothetical protein FQA39_LY11597 [Lamprigera yunnana]|nr:hypothetical protein FQA39_LY11597 [Lamprigera yunnana]
MLLHKFTKHSFQISKVVGKNARLISSNIIKCRPASYEGEGKTTVNILNNELDIGLMINGYSQVGFRLNNNMTCLGPMAIFARTVLSWNVGDVNDITPESLSLFVTLEPSLELLVIGVGDKVDTFGLHTKLFPFINKYRISLEVLSTEHACATFNFLNSEGRYIAGALIPPQLIVASDDDVLKSKLRYQSLYELDF